MKRLGLYSLCVICLLFLSLPVHAAVEIYKLQVPSGTAVPMFIDYTLNCTADVTIQILPSDSTGVPTAPETPVRTVTFTDQARGPHEYMWPGTQGDGSLAPEGWYVAKVTAQVVQQRWDPIIGVFTRTEPFTEHSARPLPSVPDGEGFYGIGVNRNPSSPYYGRIYVSHKVNKDIYMYDCDGAYLGAMNDAGIAWGGSAPWDLAVADDDYVYVSDRTNCRIYCLKPDGTGWMSQSPPTSYNKALFARTDSGTGTTYVYSTGADSIYEHRVLADHTTWLTRRPVCQMDPAHTFEALSNTYGVWVSPDRSNMLLCCMPYPSAANSGVTKWCLTPDGYTYTRCGWQNNNLGNVIDVDSTDGSALWVTRSAAYSTSVGTQAIYKLDGETGATLSDAFDIVDWGHMCSTDAVGNVAVTFGKNSPMWGQHYWALFAPPGFNTRVKYTTPVHLVTPMVPVVIPGCETWYFSDPNYPGELVPNETAYATLTLCVIDGEGWEDIGACTADMRSLGYGMTVPADSIVQDLSDPNGLTAKVTFTFRARHGTRYGVHDIVISLHDAHPAPPSTYTAHLPVAGCRMSGTIKHTRWVNNLVQGATAVAVGGMPTAYGYPFTYPSPASTAGGGFQMYVSEGTYQVHAEKLGFGSAPPATIVIPPIVSPPAPPTDAGDVFLRPLTIAEARATANGTQVSIEGLCFAQPWGAAVPSCGVPEQKGLDSMIDQMVECRQWYICDPSDPSQGILCLLKRDTPIQWDCASGVDGDGNPNYFGKRPANGETICMTCYLDTPPGHERRARIDDAELLGAFEFGQNDRYYQNLTEQGIVPLQSLPTPVNKTICDVQHGGTVPFSPIWGQYVQVTGAVVVKSVPNGLPAEPVTDAVPYCIIADMSGCYAELVIDTPSSTGISWPALGTTCTVKGAGARRNRYGNGCIKVTELIIAPIPVIPPESVQAVRGTGIGDPANVHGIETGKWDNYVYVEDADRSVGIRANSAFGYTAVGDMLWVKGNAAIEDGEKVINLTFPPVVQASNQSLPAALDMRTRDMGGASYNADNPGVTNGRGALNVGLRAKVIGSVTAKDPSATPTWYYVWDGASSASGRLDDGTGNNGIRIEAGPGTLNIGSFVEITGIVSTNATAVPGRVIPVVLPTATPTVVTAFDAVTDPTDPLAPGVVAGWNLMSTPAVPWEWNPEQVFSPYCVINSLYRWEAVTDSLIMWDTWDVAGFGGMIVGDGYWLTADTDYAVSYLGKFRGDDQWYTMPLGSNNWSLYGHPFNHPTWNHDVWVHTGAQVMPVTDAVTLGIMSPVGYWWDNNTQSLVDVGLPGFWPSSYKLVPWHGYWFQSIHPSLSLIIPNVPLDSGHSNPVSSDPYEACPEE